MKKTRILALILCLLLLAATSCAKAPTAAPEAAEATEAPEATPKPYSAYNETLSAAEIAASEEMFVDGFGAEKLAQLEEKSDAIILATVQSKRTHDNEEMLEMGLHDGTTIAELKIEQVFYSSDHLKNGDVIEMQEYCYLYVGKERTVLTTTGYYYPVKEYGTYLLFLEKQDFPEALAGYTPASLWYGKYPVNPTAVAAQSSAQISCETLELSEMNENEPAPADIVMLYGEICEKYFADPAVAAMLE